MYQFSWSHFNVKDHSTRDFLFNCLQALKLLSIDSLTSSTAWSLWMSQRTWVPDSSHHQLLNRRVCCAVTLTRCRPLTHSVRPWPCGRFRSHLVLKLGYRQSTTSTTRLSYPITTFLVLLNLHVASNIEVCMELQYLTTPLAQTFQSKANH